MFSLSSPSGSGKSILAKSLLTLMPNLSLSVSATTRAPRPGEIHGVHYYFLSEEDFRDRIRRDEFAEYEEVYEGKLYGTLRSELERLNGNGKTPIFDIDVLGAQRLKKVFGENLTTIFIQVLPKTIEARLRKRGTETEDMVQKRLARIPLELAQMEYFDVIITNEANDNGQFALMQCSRLIERKLSKQMA
jgi:guanylate kinase